MEESIPPLQALVLMYLTGLSIHQPPQVHNVTLSKNGFGFRTRSKTKLGIWLVTSKNKTESNFSKGGFL